MIAINCFFQMVRREVYLFSKRAFQTCIDTAVMLTTSSLVFGYFMAGMGLQKNYGAFILMGGIATFGLFEVTWRATLLAQDVLDQKVNNYLTLPLSPTWVFLSYAVSWALQTGFISLLMIPLGKLILWKQWSWDQFSPWKFALIFVPSNLFYGVFALWIGSLVTDLRKTSWIWFRLINPLFMFCGFYYSWLAVYRVSPIIAYVHLVNPLLYILEGTKSALLGAQSYLPLGYCVAMVWVFTGIIGYDAIVRLKKRVDSV